MPNESANSGRLGNELQRIAFLHSGEFSHINDSVAALLQRNFQGAHVDSFDTQNLDVWSRISRPKMAWNVMVEYGPRRAGTFASIRRYGCRTPQFFEASRREIHRLLAPQRYDFTLQTQSIEDASQPDTPHFLYTDHTHLTNTYYPDFRADDLYSPDWIEKERGTYRRARVIFTMSSHVTRSLIEHYQVDPAKVECVGVGANVALPDGDALPDERYARKRILFVGVDWERKGGPQLVEAFKIVRRAHPDATLTIIGCSPRLDVPGCAVLGRVPLEKMSEYYRHASLFCMPTRNEPFGVVFLEAFAYRLPAIASDLGALPDLIDNGVNGYRIPVDQVSLLAARLKSLLDSPETCKRMGQAGFERFSRRYTWEVVGRQMAERIRRELAADRSNSLSVNPGPD
jgi:glycosyltransferase involved in cell wall biosynthesis